MGRQASLRVVVCIAVSALLASLMPAGSAAPSAASGSPRGTSVPTFVERGRALRSAAALQATGCDSAPDESRCRAFRPANAEDEQDYDADRVVVKYERKADVTAAVDALSSRVLGKIGRSGAVVLDVPRGKSVPGFLKALSKEPNVVYAEPNRKLQALSEPPQTVDWGARAIRAPQAENTNNVTGDGATVAIVDSGVDYRHPDLDDNIAINAAEDHGAPGFQRNETGPGTDNDGIDDDNNGFVDDVVGYDFNGRFFTSKEPDNDPMDVLGHGTHVAGIVGAEDNAIGVRGVAPDAKLLPVRVLDDGGSGFDSEIADGIYYAVDNGADILNISLGGYGVSSVLHDAVDYAAANGVSVVSSAGNAFFYSLGSYPAAFPSVVSVAAAEDADPTTDNEPLTKVWWSDWGHTDFLAPGVNVLSTTPDNTYDRFSGTSMASPHVAGALALIHEKLADSALTPTANKLESALADDASDVYFPGKDEPSGSGVPDAEAATTISAPDSQLELYRDRYLIPSDGATGSTVTARLLDGEGDPLVGEPVTWTTDKGIVLPSAVVTDLNGEAATVLTVDDDFGAATVTATTQNFGARSIRVIVEDDRVRVDDAYIMPPVVTDEWEFFAEDVVFGDGALDTMSPKPGQSVVMRAYIGQHDYRFNDDKVTSVDWEVTDPASAVVPDLSGTLDPVVIPPAAASFENSFFESEPMTVPSDAPPGRYHLEVTANLDTGETSTFEKDFFIGTNGAEVLIVNHYDSLDVETFNFFVFHQNDSAVRRAVEANGGTFSFWDPDVHGFSVPPQVLFAHPVVIWLGGWDGTLDFDIDLLRSYANAGGNLLLSGEQFGTFARFDSSTTAYRDLFNASGLLSSFFPDDNHQRNPQSVTFADTTFDGLDPLAGTYDLGAYDLNHTGESTAIFTDELKLFPDNEAAVAATYPTGVNGDLGFEAATVLDNGTSRVLNLGFGLESINGTSDLNDAVGAILGFFEPTLSVTSVKPRRVTNDGSSFKIRGSGFQRLGPTSVQLDSKRIGSRRVTVVGRSAIKVRLPAGFKPGLYDVTVTGPDGQTDTLPNALRVIPASQ